MVKKIAVNRVDHSMLMQHPVAELLALGFRCKIAFVSDGTRIMFDDKVFTTSKEHWLDMDVDDFAEVFELLPEDIEQWFQEFWPNLAEKLEACENTMPKTRGGVIAASATANMIKMMSSMDELNLTCRATGTALQDMVDATKYNIHAGKSFGMKLMKPKTITITNPIN